jgi:hypothetical protein
MPQNNPMKYAAGGVAAVVLAFGAYAIGSSHSDQGTAGTANASAGSVPGARPGRMPQNGQGPRPGFGTPVTGTAADKVKAAVLARYQGTVERIMQLGDGSYVVHVLTSSDELHVAVSKDFKVTGAEQGGPGAGGPPGARPSQGS